MVNQKGMAPVFILIGVIIILSLIGIVYYLKVLQSASPNNAITNTSSKPVTSSLVASKSAGETEMTYPPNVLKTLVSPSGTYKAIEQQIGGGAYIVIEKQNGDVICDDLATKNFQTYQDKKDYFYQRGTHLNSWVDDSHLIINTQLGDENPYQYVVNASTCLADLSTLKSVK